MAVDWKKIFLMIGILSIIWYNTVNKPTRRGSGFVLEGFDSDSENASLGSWGGWGGLFTRGTKHLEISLFNVFFDYFSSWNTDSEYSLQNSHCQVLIVDIFEALSSLLLLLHDIYVCTVMPSFCGITIFIISPRCHFLLHHDTSFCATNFCRSLTLTPLFSCATYQARSFKFMPRWSRQEQHGVRKDTLQFTAIFISELQHNFFLFPTLLFALSLFESCTVYQNRAQLLIFVANTTYQIWARFFIFVELLFSF